MAAQASIKDGVMLFNPKGSTRTRHRSRRTGYRLKLASGISTQTDSKTRIRPQVAAFAPLFLPSGEFGLTLNPEGLLSRMTLRETGAAVGKIKAESLHGCRAVALSFFHLAWISTTTGKAKGPS